HFAQRDSCQCQKKSHDTVRQAVSTMSIWAVRACHQNRAPVARIIMAHIPVRGEKRRAAERQVQSMVTSAAAPAGMRAVNASISPKGAETAAMSQKSKGGFS